MVYSYITHKKGVHHKIDDMILKLFDNILDGMGRIDGKIFSDIIFCLTDCSFQWNYTAIDIKNFLYNDICYFIEFFIEETFLDYEKPIDFTHYFSDYKKIGNQTCNVTFQELLDLQKFFLLCIENDLSLMIY